VAAYFFDSSALVKRYVVESGTRKHQTVGYWLPPLTLVSADTDLNQAAIVEGLSIENPNDHP